MPRSLSKPQRLSMHSLAGSVGSVGMTGFTLGGGYGALIGRFGLALDSLVRAEVVLADGHIVTAKHDDEEELLWALRGGGGNFGVVTKMQHRLHPVASIRSGMLIYPFSEAKGVLKRCADMTASMPDRSHPPDRPRGRSVGGSCGLDRAEWCGVADQGETRIAPYLRLGTLLAGTASVMSYGTSLAAFDAYIVNGQRTFVETCCARQRKHRPCHPSDGDRCIAGLRHLHP